MRPLFLILGSLLLAACPAAKKSSTTAPKLAPELDLHKRVSELTLSSIFSGQVASLLSSPILLEENSFITLAAENLTLLQLKDGKSEILPIPKEELVIGLSNAAEGFAFVTFHQVSNSLYLYRYDENMRLEERREFLSEHRGSWLSSWLQMSSLAYKDGEFLFLTYVKFAPVLVVLSEEQEQTRLLPLLSFRNFDIWRYGRIFAAGERVQIVMETSEAEARRLRGEEGGSELNMESIVMAYEKDHLSFESSFSGQGIVFSASDKLEHARLSKKNELELGTGLAVERYKLENLEGVSCLYDLIAEDDRHLLVSIESGLDQAASGSILSGSFTLLLRIDRSGKEPMLVKRINGKRRVSLTKFFLCEEAICGLLFKDRPLTHDTNRSVHASIEKISIQ